MSPTLTKISALLVVIAITQVVGGGGERIEDAKCLFSEKPNKTISSAPLSEFLTGANLDPDVWQQQQQQQARAKNWHFRYVDEQTTGFDLMIQEDSADQRLANLVRTTNVARLYYYFAYKFDSPLKGLSNAQLEQLAAAPRALDDARCRRHLGEMLDQMSEMQQILELRRANGSAKFEAKHMRLARVLDSFGRYEAGLLSGKTYLLGAYNQCKGSQLLLGGELVPSRYCMAVLDATRHQDVELKLQKLEMDKNEPSEDVIPVAICLPESCHTRNFAQNKEALEQLVRSQFKLPQSIYVDKHLPLESVFCEVNEDSPLAGIPLSGKLLLVFATLWLAAIVYATYHQNVFTKSEQQITSPALLNVAKCLDLRSSWDDFTGSRDQDVGRHEGRVSLDTLNSIKVLGCFIVVMGHALMVHFGGLQDTVRAIKTMEGDPRIFFVVGITVIVDSFYVITGIFLAFIAMKKLDRAPSFSGEGDKKPAVGFLKKCAAIIGMRYLRLVPLYFLVFWFKKSLVVHLMNGSGPFSDHGYNRETEAGACREEGWWTPFNFQAAYLPLSRQCLPQAWSVAGDLFFTVVVAPILVLMSSRPLLAGLLSVALCVWSNIALLRANLLEIDAEVLANLMNLKLISISRLFRHSSYLYTAPHYRIFSVLVGMLAGYVLYHYNNNNNKGKETYQWPAWFRGPATRASLWYIFATLATTPLVPLLNEYLVDQDTSRWFLVVHLSSTNRLFWALTNACVFLRMITDWRDTYWMQMSAGKFWASMSRLNFAVLLIHVDLLKTDTYMRLNTFYYSFYSVCKTSAAIYLFSCGLAMLLHVLFENPVDKLVKSLTTKRGGQTEPTSGEKVTNKLE